MYYNELTHRSSNYCLLLNCKNEIADYADHKVIIIECYYSIESTKWTEDKIQHSILVKKQPGQRFLLSSCE